MPEKPIIESPPSWSIILIASINHTFKIADSVGECKHKISIEIIA